MEKNEKVRERRENLKSLPLLRNHRSWILDQWRLVSIGTGRICRAEGSKTNGKWRQSQ